MKCSVFFQRLTEIPQCFMGRLSGEDGARGGKNQSATYKPETVATIKSLNSKKDVLSCS